MNPARTPASDDKLDEQIIESMLRNGAAFPMTKEEVKAAKPRLLRSVGCLPKHMSDATEVCRRILQSETARTDNVVPLPPNEFAAVKCELARAARNGKAAISATVEERMRANRAKAKRSNV